MEKEIQEILNRNIGRFSRSLSYEDYKALHEHSDDAASAIAYLVEERMEKHDLEVARHISYATAQYEADKVDALEVQDATWRDQYDKLVAQVAQMREALEGLVSVAKPVGDKTDDGGQLHIIPLAAVRKAKAALSSARCVVWRGKGHMGHRIEGEGFEEDASVVIFPDGYWGCRGHAHTNGQLVELIMLDASEKGGEDE